jgi:hypothetical protein
LIFYRLFFNHNASILHQEQPEGGGGTIPPIGIDDGGAFPVAGVDQPPVTRE